MKLNSAPMKEPLDRQLSHVNWTAEDTLSVLRRMEKEEQPVKRKLSTALVFALILTLLTAAALAAGVTGLLDILDSTAGGGRTLPQASELVQTDLAAIENDGAVYRIREAIYDGYAAYVLVEIEPKDPKVLLIPETYLPSDPTRGLIEDDEAPLRTIAEYAEAGGYTGIAHVSVGVWGNCSVRDSWQDNKISLAISFSQPGEALDLAFSGTYIPFLENDALDWDKRLDCETSFTLTAAEPNWTLTSTDALSYPEGGFEITGLTLTGTAMATYYELTYTITDIDRYQNTHTQFRFCDLYGNRYDNSVMMLGHSNLAKENGDVVVRRDSLEAMAEKPESIYLELVQPTGHTFTLK